MRSKHILLAFLVMGMLIFGCVEGGPKAPTGVTAKAVAGGIDVSWQPSESTNVDGYNVYRSTASGDLGAKLNAALITSNSYEDKNVENGVTYYYTVRTVDTSGNEDTNTNQASATASTGGPANLQLTIDGGAQYTSSAQVTLTISATDAYECKYSNDGNEWSSWEAYSTTKSWALTSGDGHKDVYIQCKDSVGNTAAPVSSSIYLDTQGPEITIMSPESGGEYPGGVHLNFTLTDPISSTVTCTGKLDGGDIAIGVVDVGKVESISLSAGEGTHTVTISCTDNVHSAEESVTFSIVDKATLSIHIESGSGHVSTRTVMIDLTAKNAAYCRFSNDNTLDWGSWFGYVIPTSVQWTLSSGDGMKYVFAECKSAAGVVSDAVSDGVELDTSQHHKISVQINDGASTTNGRNVRLGLYCYNADECRYSNDGDSWSSWADYTTSKHWELSSGEGVKHVYYNCRDEYGDDLGEADATIRYRKQDHDNPPSSLSIMINHGASHTTSTDVSLELYAKDADECRFKNDGESWTGWYGYGSSRDWTLSDGDGSKEVYYQCRNDYGTSSTAHASIYLDTGPPPPVTDLTATVHNDIVHLRWTRPSATIVSYNIYRSTHSLGLFSKLTSTRTTSYNDEEVVEGEGYSYTVRGVDSAGNEAPDSNMVNADIPLPLGPGPVIPNGDEPSGEVGGDTDEHGCDASAGYTWCEAKQKCLREWEEPCEDDGEEPVVE